MVIDFINSNGRMVVIDQSSETLQSSSGRSASRAPVSCRTEASPPKFDNDEFIMAIDELFVQSKRDSVTVGDVVRLLEAQFGNKLDKAARALVKQRLTDLVKGKVQSRVPREETPKPLPQSHSHSLTFHHVSTTSTPTPMVSQQETTVMQQATPTSSSRDTNDTTLNGALEEASSSNINTESLQRSVDRFQAVSTVLKECEAHLQELSRDRSRNHEEVIQEASFWQERIQQWKSRLSSVCENGSQEDETLTKDVERFLSAMKPIKECQSHIQLLATDSLRTRQEVANETWFWRQQQEKWKEMLFM